MEFIWQIPFDPELDQAVRQFLDRPGPRIGALSVRGECFWLKRVDHPNLINRIQKGPPLRAFRGDLAGIKQLQALAVPVAQVVIEGPEFFVMRDCGPSLDGIMRYQKLDRPERIMALETAARELAALHAKQIAHGRPILRDLCWKDGQITFLDFENFSPGGGSRHDCMRDLVAFVFSCYSEQRAELPEIVAAKAVYRENDPDQIWDLAQKWIGKMRWVNWLTKPMQRRKDPHAREFKAIPVTMRAFGVNVR